MSELFDWLAALDPVFAFLLALPFAVAAAAFAAEALRRSRARRTTALEPAPRRYTPSRGKRGSGHEVAR